MLVFSTDHLPGDDAGWRTYRKKVFTQMIKVDGPFRVMTSEGLLTCQDGFLAIDARGYPYPLATEEQKLIYEEVTEDSA
jgi:hypothetical protein